MKKNLWIFFFFLVLVATYLIIDTYALLESNAGGTLEVPVGKWEITLNGIDILETKEISFSDLSYVENPYVEDGYFAPGVSATYEIVVDPHETDVAIRYDIAVDVSAVESHPNILFVASSDTITPNEDGLSYSGIISLDDIKSGNLIKINIIFNWSNIESYNELDSTLMVDGAELSIPLTIKFSQYTGEAL